jgi:hypothetical protein
MKLYFIPIILLILLQISSAQQFPVTPLGHCYDGVKELSKYYPAEDILFCYNQFPEPGHVWLLVRGQPIDSYYGLVDATYYWTHPEHTYKTFDELDKGIIELTGCDLNTSGFCIKK